MAPNTEADEFHGENPIKMWVFEVVPLHGDAVTDADRLEQMAEVVDRLAASTGIGIEEAFDYAKEARKSHRRMAEEAAFQGTLADDEAQALINTFDRLVTAWINSPTEIDAEVSEYKAEIETLGGE